MKRMRAAKLSALVLLPMAFMVAGNALAQETSNAIQLEVKGDDVAAATAMTSAVRYHLLLTPQARAKGISADSPNVRFKQRAHPALTITSLPSPPANSFYYPDDMEKVASTGKTITSAASHPIYINCATPATCWGSPATLLQHLGASNMIHLVDQYTGSTANNRYTVGASVNATMTIYAGTTGVPTLGENDILGVVHAAAKNIGTGYSHIYHVFIPKGVDTCMDEGLCYSPDNPNTFQFCGYHFTVKFADLASPVYYTVEPFQGPMAAPAQNFCTIPFATVNGALVDSTATVLLHETFETITDPDINTGYRAVNSDFGEVGDVCEGFLFQVTLNAKAYDVQSIYSDHYEACATTP